MTIENLDNVGIAVCNLQTTITFFEKAVGLKVTSYADATPRSATVQVGERYLYIFETSGAPTGARRSPDLVGNPPGLDHVSFTVSNIDLTCAEMRRRGVTFASEPFDVDEWSLRMVPFADPDGNVFFLVQPL